MPDNWIIAIRKLKLIEESPGSIKTQCQLMAGEGDFRDSATENKPPYQGKGETRGKTSPVFEQKTQGKPHWEQG